MEYTMTKATELDTPIPSRRALLAGAPAAAAGALLAGTAVGAVVISMVKAGEVDPIFALIEKHKAACDAAQVFCMRADMRSSDPNYDAAQTQFQEAYKVEREALVALLTCQPTTLAGVTAVLEHVGRLDWVFGDDSEHIVLTDAHEREIEEAEAFPKHLAAALRDIVERRPA
jgi:hypothetical protein